MIETTFVIYLLIVLALGYLAYRKTRDLADYILGGRRLGPWVTALSAQASDMSGWLLLGLPGLAYRVGLAASWMPLGLLVGTYLNWRFVAPCLREATQRLGNALTIPDYFEARFDDSTRLLRFLAALGILIFFTLYTGAMLVAGGLLFQSVFGIDYVWAVTAGAVTILLYTAFGGFLAVSWTDTLQAGLMFVALVGAGLVGLWALGGFAGAGEAVRDHDPDLLRAFVGEAGASLGVVGILSSLAWGLGYFGQPHILVRFMAIEQPQRMGAARRIAMGWVTVCLFFAVAVGLIGAGYYGPGLMADGDDSERVFIHLVNDLFHPLLAGVALAAILAAVMSTADSQLLVASSAVTEDLYRGLIRDRAGPAELVWVGRAAVVGVALTAFALASDPDSRVLELVAYAWAGFGATFGPVILASLLWRRMSGAAAAAGMIVGAVTIFAWRAVARAAAAAAERLADLDQPYLTMWDRALATLAPMMELYELLPGFTLSLLAILLVTWLWPGKAGAHGD